MAAKLSSSQLSRPILTDPVDAEGFFTLPSQWTADDEVRWAKRRMDSIRVSQYADSRCGLPNTLDLAGAYLCGGRENGTSVPCNKFIIASKECLIRIKPISSPGKQSCGYWETQNAGDPEGRYCPKGKLEDDRIGFGSTTNPLGFSCQRCEYGEGVLPRPDSEGRTKWCKFKGHPVEPKACCEDNEPDDDAEDDEDDDKGDDGESAISPQPANPTGKGWAQLADIAPKSAEGGWAGIIKGAK